MTSFQDLLGLIPDDFCLVLLFASVGAFGEESGSHWSPIFCWLKVLFCFNLGSLGIGFLEIEQEASSYHSAAAQTCMCKASLNPVAIIIVILFTRALRGNHRLALVAHVCGPSSWETGARGSRVLGQPRLQSNSVSKNNKETHDRESPSLLPF